MTRRPRLWPAVLVALLAVVLAATAGVLAFGAIPTGLAFAAVAVWVTADELADRAAVVDDPPPSPAPPRPPVTPSPSDPGPSPRTRETS